MTSVYKKDFGNGVVIYADDYVNTGKWVFDCRYSRLISRHPLPAPLAELERAKKITIGSMYDLSDHDEEMAKTAIRSITNSPNWYKGLRYLYSGLDENSDLNMHAFDLLATHNEQQWAIIISQHTYFRNESDFYIIAKPYNPDTYMDYSKVLEAATKSCPAPQ